MEKAAQIGQYSDGVKSVLRDSGPVLFQMLLKYGSPEMIFGYPRPGNDPLIAKYAYLLSTWLIVSADDQCFLEALWT